MVAHLLADAQSHQLCLQLGIEDKIPDHSIFSRARNERFRDHDIFRQVFERVVAACIRAGLVRGEGFAVDASLPTSLASDNCRSRKQSLAAEDARWAAEAKAAEDARRAAEAKAAEDARWAAEAKADEDARRAAEGTAAEETRRAAEAKAAEDARRAAEAVKAKAAAMPAPTARTRTGPRMT
jgi:hypothetical protein